MHAGQLIRLGSGGDGGSSLASDTGTLFSSSPSESRDRVHPQTDMGQFL